KGWPKQDIAGKLDTAAKLMQTFTAESMRDGLGQRKTFNLEFDSAGKVVIHTLRYPAQEVDLWRKDMGAFWGELYGWLEKQFPFDKNKCLVVMGFSHWDQEQKRAYAHTALGGGGLGLFGNSAMWSWPSTLGEVDSAFRDPTPVPAEVHDDSAYRSVRWALASTTIGAMLHEMGHTFGLPHTSDPRSIMTRGFDRFNRMFTLVEPPEKRRPEALVFKLDEVAHWGPVDAAELFYHRWFQPDARVWNDDRPTVNSTGSTWTIQATNGIGMVKWFLSAKDKSGRDIHNPLEFTFYRDQPKSLSFDAGQVASKHKAEAGVRVKVMDVEGNVTEFDRN
ncbi:MAG TPA: matrixin family metalloprotease, partial [Fimbriimonadaceae bacterium]|nr:matrixin family metalloprotease [Fimbriimonadaceae bacterium]